MTDVLPVPSLYSLRIVRTQWTGGRDGEAEAGPPLLSSSFRCSQGGRGRSAGGEGGVASPRTCGESAWISRHAPPSSPRTHPAPSPLSPVSTAVPQRTRRPVSEGRQEQAADRQTGGHQGGAYYINIALLTVWPACWRCFTSVDTVSRARGPALGGGAKSAFTLHVSEDIHIRQQNGRSKRSECVQRCENFPGGTSASRPAADCETG